MQPITRRTLLTAVAATTAMSACSTGDERGETTGAATKRGSKTGSKAGPIAGIPTSQAAKLVAYEPNPAFPEGILSGSPLPTAVVFWTRVATEELDQVVTSPDGSKPISVELQLATDPEFSTVIASKSADATADNDHCVHIDLDGLTPSSWYYYRFVVGDPTTSPTISPVGRTRTAPDPAESVASANIAFFSCQRYTHGWFTSHRHLAGQEDLDLVISLGDYVYQDSKADDIVVEGRLDPTEPADDLTTFRAKYEFYRSDPDLQAMHAAAPFVCVPDNHDGRDGPWDDAAFVEGAIGAFFERMPVRRNSEEPGRIYHDTQWGDLFHLWMLDVRQYRDEPPGDTLNTLTEPAAWDPTRTTLGPDQKAWLKDGLVGTNATWKLIGSQLMFSPTRITDLDDVTTRAAEPDRPKNAGIYINGTQWDGFQTERNELVSHLHDNKVANTIVLSGDMHWFAAGDGQLDVDDPASPYVYSEFVGGSVTSAAGEKFSSNGGLVTPGILPVVRAANEQLIRFFDVDRHGYGALRLSGDATEIDFVSPTTITKPDAEVEVLASFRIPAGGTGMEVTKGAQW